MRKPRLSGWLLLVFTIAGCGDRTPPAGSVAVTPAEVPLFYPGFSAIELAWSPTESLTDLQGDLRASIHLVGDGEVLRTFDRTLDFEWTPGTTQELSGMLFQSALAPPLERGTYELRIGLYDGAGHTWKLDGPGATVRVEDQAAGFPAFYFAPEWLPIEGGTDRQILGRRWLQADGVIRLGQMTRPGILWLQLGVPTPVSGVQEMSFDEGASEPEVTVAGCGFDETFVGSGSHQMRIAIEAGADGSLAEECEIAFDTNYTLIAIEDRVHRTIALESLSWLTR